MEMKKRETEYAGVVKNCKALYPRTCWLEQQLKGCSVVSRLVLIATCKGVDLVAMGYKYNKNVVVCLLSTARAGNTNDGRPYVQR